MERIYSSLPSFFFWLHHDGYVGEKRDSGGRKTGAGLNVDAIVSVQPVKENGGEREGRRREPSFSFQLTLTGGGGGEGEGLTGGGRKEKTRPEGRARQRQL